MTQRKERYSSEERQKVLQSVSGKRVFLPILLGVIVVVFLFYRQFDPHEFSKIRWTSITLFWICCALACLFGRIMCYALRLKKLSGDEFSLLKSIQLIFIWEFSSAVSPTNVGGSAVALFVLSREKIGAAKTTAIVIYTIVLDTLFALLCIPLWVLLFGTNILGPGRDSVTTGGGWEITLLLAYSTMLLYGSFFSYGLFVNPRTLRKMSIWIGRLPFLKRYRERFRQLGADIATTSKALAKREWKYHTYAFITTAGAWSFRFLLIICLIIGITNSVPLQFGPILELYARIQTMFVIMAFSPTPGGAGLAEILFGSLLTDYVPAGISLVVATIWRAMAYYFFLFAGAIIIPQWIGKKIKERKRKLHLDTSDKEEIKQELAE